MNVQIDEGDLQKLLSEKSRLEQQVTELQRRGTELVQENRALCKLGENSINTAVVLCQQRAKQALPQEEYDASQEFWSEKFWQDAATYLASKLGATS